MAVDFNLILPSQVPVTVPHELWPTINDLYTQLNNLVSNLNSRYGVIQSPNGHYWRVNISDLGVVTTTDLGTYLS